MTAATGSVAENLANADHAEPLAPHQNVGTTFPAGHETAAAEPTALGLDATAYVALAMLVVIALMLWKKVPAAIGRALDKKIAGIRAQLDEASRLRAEAEALKAEYEAKSAAANSEADAIRASAQHEADAVLAKARADADALVARRARMAEDKIGAAERDAIAQVRAKAASAATRAAATLIAETHDRSADKVLVDQAISRLN
jgi:F-type H+-transporting ATPase subunit b